MEIRDKYFVSNHYKEVLQMGKIPIENYCEEIKKYPEYAKHHSDLHIYPYINSNQTFLSCGCKRKCQFCLTAEIFKGKRIEGDEKIIIPKYKRQSVHFMDEDFFLHSRLGEVLKLLKEHKVEWLAMATYTSTLKAIKKFGAKYLSECGCRVIEVGLENVIHCMKVGEEPISNPYIQICYLNMSFFPGETKHSLKANAEWLRTRSLQRPIHHNMGLWYSPGKFYYKNDEKDGRFTSSKRGAETPTYIPNSFLKQSAQIINLEHINFYSRLVMKCKYFPKKETFLIEDFIFGDEFGEDWSKAYWLAIGIACGGII